MTLFFKSKNIRIEAFESFLSRFPLQKTNKNELI